MAKFNDVTREGIRALYRLGQKPTADDYYTFIDAIQDGIEGHEHRLGGGQGSGTGDAEADEYLYQVLDVNMYNIHAFLRLLTTRPELAVHIPITAWTGS